MFTQELSVCLQVHHLVSLADAIIGKERRDILHELSQHVYLQKEL